MNGCENRNRSEGQCNLSDTAASLKSSSGSDSDSSGSHGDSGSRGSRHSEVVGVCVVKSEVVAVVKLNNNM